MSWLPGWVMVITDPLTQAVVAVATMDALGYLIWGVLIT